MKKGLKGIGIFILALQLQACGEMEIPDPNPGGNTGVDFTININNNPYTALKTAGGSAIVTDKKVIVVKPADNSIPAYVALQSYCPSDASVNLTYNSSNRTFVCSKDNSTYDLTGKGTSTSLKRYSTTFSSNSGDIRVFE
jgi:hypothetical protein